MGWTSVPQRPRGSDPGETMRYCLLPVCRGLYVALCETFFHYFCHQRQPNAALLPPGTHWCTSSPQTDCCVLLSDFSRDMKHEGLLARCCICSAERGKGIAIALQSLQSHCNRLVRRPTLSWIPRGSMHKKNRAPSTAAAVCDRASGWGCSLGACFLSACCCSLYLEPYI